MAEEKKETPKKKVSTNTKRVINLRDRVEIELKDGSKLMTHPENVYIYEEKGLLK